MKSGKASKAFMEAYFEREDIDHQDHQSLKEKVRELEQTMPALTHHKIP